MDTFLIHFIMLAIVSSMAIVELSCNRHPKPIKPTNKDKQCGHVNKAAN